MLSDRPRRGVLLGAVVLLAALLRLPWLGAAVPLGNEYLYFHLAAHARGWADFLRGVHGNALHLFLQPAVDFLMARFRDDPAWLRLPAALFGTAAVAGLWRFCEEAELAQTAPLASLLLAVSLMHVEWSRRADMYALISALTVWQAAAFARLARGGKTPSLPLWDAALLGASPYAAPLAAIEAAALAWRRSWRPALRRFLAGWALAAAVVLPWLAFTARDVGRLLGGDFVAAHPEARVPLGPFLARLPLFLAQGAELSDRLDHWSPGLGAALAVLYLICYAASALRLRREDSPPALRFCHAAVWGGLALTIGLDLAFGNYLAPRQTLWVLPFYLAAVADGASVLARRLPSRSAAAALGGAWLAASLGLVGSETWRHARFETSFENVLSAVRAHVEPGDTISFASDRLAQDLLYSLDRPTFERLEWRRIPQGLTLPLAGSTVRVVVAEGRRQALRRDVWRFEGTSADLTVVPALRSAGAAAYRASARRSVDRRARAASRPRPAPSYRSPSTPAP